MRPDNDLVLHSLRMNRGVWLRRLEDSENDIDEEIANNEVERIDHTICMVEQAQSFNRILERYEEHYQDDEWMARDAVYAQFIKECSTHKEDTQ